jgi:3-oxoacyl-[acyl-carrier-protein] synthase II
VTANGESSGRGRVWVTGIGAVTPLGVGARALHRRWAEGECGIEDGMARCDEFAPGDFLSSKEARRADRFTQLALAAAGEALFDAGWDGGHPYEPAQIACVVGTGVGGLGSLESQHKVLLEGRRSISPLSVPLLMGNAAAAQVAMRHNLRGPTFGVVSACAAGAHAIGAAMQMVRSGEATAVVTGGAESAITPLAEAAFAAMGATSETGISRPFDRRRDGFVMGEGAGILVLEDAAAAGERGARPLAELAGYGATSDAFHLTAPEPDGAGAAQAMSAALKDAGLAPENVDYINAHGTSTPLNDRSETEAIKTAFGEQAAGVPISSAKSAVGHLLGAAGAVEAIATALALREGILPPTLGYEELDEGLDLDYVPGQARSLSGGENGNGSLTALSNSFGFGGHNAVLCVRAERTGKASK